MSATSITRNQVYQLARSRIDVNAYAELLETITSVIYSEVIKEGDVAIDCGANVGRHSIAMARLVGDHGKIHAFEASPLVLPWLKARLAEARVADRVIVHEAAVARASGALTFHATEGGAYGMSGLQPRKLSEELQKTVRYVPTTVRAVRLDEVFASSGRIMFIKLDLEGGEFDALVGARAILRKWRPCLVFENGRSESATDYGYTPDSFFAYFDAIGYRLYDAFGYPFEPDDWTRGGVPWQFVGLPNNVSFELSFGEGVQQAMRTAGLAFV